MKLVHSTRRAGRPTKWPRLVKHTALLDAPDQVRHRIFSLQPSGQISLRTSYTTPDLTPDGTLFDAQPQPADTDPWNEVEQFTPALCEDTSLGTEVLKARHRKTVRVCLACFTHHTNLTLKILG